MSPAVPLSYEQAVASLTAPGQIFELTTVDVAGVTYRAFRHAPGTLREVYELARAHGDATFLVYGDERASYAETMAAVDACAAALVEDLGVRRGDRVAIAMRNYPEWVVAFCAVTAIGAVSVSMNAWWTADELDYALADCAPRVLIADPPRAARAQAATERLGVQVVVVRHDSAVTTPGWRSWDALVSPGRRPPAVEVGPDDDATILYTSGTTGRPKGAVSTQRAVVQALMGFAARAAIAALVDPPDDPDEPRAMLLAVPLFHVTGCIPVMLGSLVGGSKLVMMHRWDPEQALRLIETERITTLIGVPTQTIDLLSHPRFAEFDTASLRSVGGGGAPPPPALMAEIDRSFPNGSPGFGYGMTETNALGPAISGADALRKPSSAGRVPIIMEVEIHDPVTGARLGVGERGEIWQKGPNLIRGYWRNPAATAETLVDGWLRSGDIGHLDEEGFVYVEDRLKDMVLRGGENVYCAEVEAVLYTHPAVQEVAVFGVPDPRLGENVAAVVRLREGASVTAAELAAFAGEHLAPFKVPARIDIRTTPLPRNPAGKFLKRTLRDELSGG